MKKLLSLILCSIIMIGLVGCGASNKDSANNESKKVEKNKEETPKTRVVTDANGNEIEIPNEVTKVVNLWNSANEIIFQLGGGDLMVGGSSFLQSRPWMTHINPKAEEIKVVSDGGTANNEAILALDPEAIISVAGRADSLKELGEPVVELTGGNTYEELMEQIEIVAKVLGPKYEENANTYFEYFNKNLDLAREKSAKIPEEEQLVVLHGTTSEATLDDSLTGSLMKELNMKNAFAGATGSEISYEQILAANPDVIIVSTGNHAEYEKFMTDPLYANLKAVKNNKVFINPAGMFYWDAFSGEAALQVLWFGQTVYPEYFKDADLNKETKYFYKTFLNYEMTDQEIDYLYEGKGPNGEWQ